MPTPTTKDHENARELRKLLLRGTGSAWLDVSYVRRRFGGGAFSTERRQIIDSALEAAGVTASPSVADAGRGEQTFLEVRGSASKEHHPLLHRLLWRWRRTRTLLILPGISLLTIAASVVSLEAIWTPNRPSAAPVAPVALTRMSGDLNIAVAPFAQVGRSRADGLALAEGVDRALRRSVRQLDAGLDIQIRGPHQVAEATGGNGANEATVLATRIGADIVVYGSLNVSAEATTLVPKFYVNATKLPAATELGGDFGYGKPISVPYSIDVSPQQRAYLRSALLGRTLVVTSAFIGVGYYITHKIPQATEAFTRTLRLSGHEQPTVALARLFLGNILAQRRRFHQAEQHYQAAAASAPLRGRAMWGLAEVAYQRARGSCNSVTADQGALRRARLAFTHVPTPIASASSAAALALQAKVSFGLGQVDLCLSHAGLTNHWDAARREFAQVTRAYAGQRAGLRDDAAEAFAALGLIDLETTTDALAGSASANLEYRRAAHITTNGGRRIFFDWMIGQTAKRSGHRAAAADAFRAGLAMRLSSRWRRRFRQALRNVTLAGG